MRIFVNGVIVTMDPARPRAGAVACDDQGSIVAVGDTADLRGLAARPSDIVDLGGRYVVPGFIDVHIHLTALGQILGYVNLEGASGAAECAERLAVRLTSAPPPPGAWLVGSLWNRDTWVEGATTWPSARDLDAQTGDRPTVVRSKDLHMVWANSAALRAAGIDASTPDPVGGHIVRDPDGTPAGVLQENAATLLLNAMPALTSEGQDAAVERALAHVLALGVTGVGSFEGMACWRSLDRLRGHGKLSVRANTHIAKEELDEVLATGIRSGDGDDWLRIGQYKLFADGALGSRTAAMLEPYDDAPGRGIVTLTGEEISALTRRAAAGGIASAVHAIGDSANREVLRALAGVERVAAMPHRIEHVQVLHPHDLPLFARHGIIASMQPIHMVGDRDVAIGAWGERAALSYAWRPLLESGAVLSFGSDAPVEKADPLLGLYAAVARHGRDDGRAPWRPELGLTVQQALRAYTVGATAATGERATKGVLKPGAVADMAVLSHDIFGDDDALAQARVAAVIVGGHLTEITAP